MSQNGTGRGGARPGAGRRPKSGRPKNLGRYLYVVQATDDGSACKIGIAANPYKRLPNLRRRYLRPLRLVGIFGAAGNSEAWQIELAAKASMKPIRILGDWYKIDFQDLAQALNTTAQSLGLTLISEPLREVGQRGGRRPGAGRRTGVPNKKIDRPPPRPPAP